MVWRRLFHRDKEPDESGDSPSEDQAADHSTSIERNPPANAASEPPTRQLPSHLEEQFASRRKSPEDRADPRRKLETLRRRRTAALYDIEQGELALADDNPWKERVSLLTEALETVDDDRKRTEQVEAAPWHPVPDIPITDMSVTFNNDVATVRFVVGEQQLVYEEPLDWAERGHQITRTELVRNDGEVDPLVPSDTPAELQDVLRSHLELSLFVLATDLRERTLNDERLPSALTLADLAKPCPQCGGWMDYLGRCQECARRTAELQRLFRERDRLLNERAAELEEEHRLAERLPLAQRRLADIDTEIAALEKRLADEA